jgi:hypothetical protein
MEHVCLLIYRKDSSLDLPMVFTDDQPDPKGVLPQVYHCLPGAPKDGKSVTSSRERNKQPEIKKNYITSNNTQQLNN